MNHKNVEIKARCASIESLRKILNERGARFVGRDHQTDTYFNCPDGRLKLREGNIESGLIYYARMDQAGPKVSRISRWESTGGPLEGLRLALESALGVLVVVDKEREIYFVENVKIHLDRVSALGAFVEIEATDTDESRSVRDLELQCKSFMKLFKIKDHDLAESSYSDMILAGSEDTTSFYEQAA